MKRLAQVVALALLAAACTGASKAGAGTKEPPPAKGKSSGTAKSAKKFPVVIQSDAAGTCEAIFDGEAPPPELDVPLVFGTTQLAFMFKGQKTAYKFEPKGELHFSDWTFDIFSPDGKYVALLQDRFGPYHIVAVDRLAAYLQGKAEPAKVVTEPRPEGQAALVHSKGRWVSAGEFEYEVGGETQETKRATVP